MPYVETAELRLHYRLFGSGLPVTVFGHGVASSIDDSRWLASGVSGTRVFLHFRGHGASGAPYHGYDYAGMTRDLRAVADATGATRAVGISMGAGAIIGLLAEQPDRFDRCVLALPAALDEPRPEASITRLRDLADVINRGERNELVGFLLDALPDDLRRQRGMHTLMAARAEQMLAGQGVERALRSIWSQPPIPDRAALSAVSADCLVIAHEGDESHPAGVARELAASLPRARLHLFDQPWAMLRERATLRDLIRGHLAGEQPVAS